ncbi:hypothetical protein Hanom_Chr10g00936641 [Helianthus anomalus]
MTVEWLCWSGSTCSNFCSVQSRMRSWFESSSQPRFRKFESRFGFWVWVTSRLGSTVKVSQRVSLVRVIL